MDETPAMETLDELLSARHSCRAFLPNQIPRETIRQIVETAQKVPSWCNAQPWQLIVTEGRQTDAFRAALMDAALRMSARPDIAFPVRYSGVYRERRSACGWQLYDAVGVSKGDRAASARQMQRNFALFDAPHVAIVTTPVELGAYGVLDCGAFVTGFALAAQALGVGSIPQAAVAGMADTVRGHFGLSSDRQVVCAISFGREDKGHPANGFRTPRARLGEVVDWR